MKISAIALVGKNWELGRNNDLIWKLPEDMRHFRKTTEFGSVLMGRKTYESIGSKPLPKRRNYVLSSRCDRGGLFMGDLNFVGSLPIAIDNAMKSMCHHMHIIGGGQIYDNVIRTGLVHEIVLTRVNQTAPDADVFFPNLDSIGLYVETNVEPLVEGASIHTYTRIDLM